ncbi:MAG: tripartite tricarboxylate transporter TctB family protein [candidate division NC10 bacterium]|nr:tripartite tricarboxylate transporter TctB family protein [candidate division NC10 bacterium]
MRKAEMAVAGVIFLWALSVLYEVRKLNVGWGLNGPEAGFFPFWLAAGLAGSGALIFLQAARAGGGAEPFVTWEALKGVLRVSGPLAAFIGLLYGVGFYVGAALYIGYYTRVAGRHRWPVVGGMTLGIPMVIFLLFERWLLVPLPKGPIEQVLGF